MPRGLMTKARNTYHGASHLASKGEGGWGSVGSRGGHRGPHPERRLIAGPILK